MLSKKRLTAIMLSSILAVTVTVGGATYALFTSSAKNTDNSFKAGTVSIDIERDGGETLPGPMFYSAASDPTGSFPYDTNKNDLYQPPGGEAIGGWAPGDSALRAMNIYNTGTLPVKITGLKAVVNLAGVTNGLAYDEFIQKMYITVTCAGKPTPLYSGPLCDLIKDNFVSIPAFIIQTSPSAPVNVSFTATLDKSAGNNIQGQKFVFDFVFHAEQLKNNP